MQEPCRCCERKTRDFGGCRCQAFLYTGDADATDPVCSLSPQRGLIDAVIANDPADDRNGFIASIRPTRPRSLLNPDLTRIQSISPFRTANRTSSPVECRFSFSMILPAMRFHGVNAQVERRRDLLIGLPFGDLLQYFALAAGQQIQRIGDVLAVIRQHRVGYAGLR